MKKIIIGRNNACDIIIPDTTDLVSRKQAVLAIDFWGKMILFDTSNNGTFVNGQRIENGKGMRVTRKDKVNFAQVAELDWNQVEDPYRKARIRCPQPWPPRQIGRPACRCLSHGANLWK